MTKPIVTYVLYAFNEAKYIRAAIESAFNQSYSPLEVVLSDDGSTDGTFEIMEQMAAGYAGPHKIILNRNERNTGIGSQINAAYLKGRGELIVLANGDDVSRAERVERVVAEWLAGGRTAAGISCLLEIIGPSGVPTGRVMDTSNEFNNLATSVYRRFGGPVAAGLAVRRDCFDRFGLLAENLIIEDGPLCMRATLLGGWVFIPETLVQYRVHDENISQAYHVAEFPMWRRRHHEKQAWHTSEGQKAFLQMLVDLYSGTGRDDHLRRPAEIHEARVKGTQRLLELQLLQGYYSEVPTLRLPQWWKLIAQIALLAGKIWMKRAIPLLEWRNDRWHWRNAMKHTPGQGQSG